ncbi:hypothetical protein [Streptomyces sp. NPDC001422]|uniref:hypothetical protein n=1 Tax=Streptomyces sp. NPDC001422 TaxID=3364575 RepID=UPI003683887F
MTDSDASPGNGEPAAASSDGAEFLAICLNDHLTGASTGTELLGRAVRARESHDGGTALAELAQQGEQDRESLIRIMMDLKVSSDHAKVAIGRLAGKAGRLKLNGRLFSRSPLSDVLELEALLVGVERKAACWRVLRVLAETDGRLHAEHLDTLLERAEQQVAILEEMRMVAAAGTFGVQSFTVPVRPGGPRSLRYQGL